VAAKGGRGKKRNRKAPPPRRQGRKRLATFGAVTLAALIALATGLLVAWAPPDHTLASSEATPTPEAPGPTATPTPLVGPAAPATTLRLVAVASDGSPPPEPEPTPAAEPSSAIPTSPEGLRLWSHGDSTSYFMTIALYQIWRDQGGSPVTGADYKVSTGLARPDFFDWASFVGQEMARYNPDVAVLMVGGNDILQMGRHETYAARVGKVMDLMYREGRIVVWLGQPNFGPGREAMANGVHTLNAVFQEEAAKRPWVIYVDTFGITSWSDGSFAWEQADIFGNLVKIRHDDGVHFTSAGGRHLAVGIMGALFGPH
jgi:uncharacterized protein